MAQQVKQATHAVHDGVADTDATDALDSLATTSFRHHRHLHHGKNPIYTHKSSSSLLLADDEDDLAGNPDEADAPHVIARPKRAKRCSSQSSDAGSRHDSECDRTPRITKRFCSDSSITPRNRKHGSETMRATATRKVALFVPDRGKGKGRAVDLSPCTDTRTTDERCAQDSEDRAGVCTASREPPDDASNRSSAEVEQILPSTEHASGLDPRDFYASDSPVLDEYFDSGQDSHESDEEFLECINPEVQDDDQAESSVIFTTQDQANVSLDAGAEEPMDIPRPASPPSANTLHHVHDAVIEEAFASVAQKQSHVTANGEEPSFVGAYPDSPVRSAIVSPQEDAEEIPQLQPRQQQELQFRPQGQLERVTRATEDGTGPSSVRLISLKLSQKSQALPCQRLLSQPQPLTPSSQVAWPSSSRQMLPLQPSTTPMQPPTTPVQPSTTPVLSRRNRPGVSQHRDAASQPQPLTTSSQVAWPSSSRQMLPLQPPTTPVLSRHNRHGVSQHRDAASGGHFTSLMCRSAGSQSADLGQLESHTNAAGFPDQIVNNLGRAQEQRGRSNISQKIGKRRGRSPQRRGTENLQLAVLVRMEIENLLQEDPPYGRTPEPSRVSTFVTEWKRTGQGAKACDATPADFMIDVAGLPRSPWNISAARIFTDHFIQKMEYKDTPETRKTIEKAFTNRIRSLKSRGKKESLSQAERAVERSKHARRQRKYQLFQRRRNIAKLVEPLTEHLGILDALGDDGMSTDESFVDPDTHQTTYAVTKPEWRHPDLHNWLRVFDQLHHRSHIESWSLDKRGAFPHIRAGSQKVHLKSHAPTGLPINAYDPKWIGSREPLYLNHVLCPQMEQQYDFTHSSDVFALLSR